MNISHLERLIIWSLPISFKHCMKWITLTSYSRYTTNKQIYFEGYCSSSSSDCWQNMFEDKRGVLSPLLSPFIVLNIFFVLCPWTYMYSYTSLNTQLHNHTHTHTHAHTHTHIHYKSQNTQTVYSESIQSIYTLICKTTLLYFSTPVPRGNASVCFMYMYVCTFVFTHRYCPSCAE